jgi:putative flippase GtrA
MAKELPVSLYGAFIRYAGVGLIGTVAHYAVLLTLVNFANIAPVLASTIGAVVGACINYVLNYRFTFASRRDHVVAVPRFVTIAALGLVVNAAVMALALSLGLNSYLLAQVVATAAVLIMGYLANRRWTF